MTKTLKCDKPVDLDEARKAKGLPRRKRDDPKATAYELRIRVPAEFQGVMGRKKLSRTVFARNTVSYTHLDVYKRQVLSLNLQAAIKV